MRKSISPKLSTSFFDQSCRGALNRRLILSKWYHSLSLLPFSNLPFLTFFSCSLPVLCAGLDLPVNWRSAGCWFTATSFASSSSATARFDQDQLATSGQSEERKYVRLERAMAVVLSSFDFPPVGMEASPTRQIAPSRPFR